MRTLNVRLAVICFVVVVVMGGGVHLLHGFQVRRQAYAIQKASETAEEGKDLKEAIRLLDNFLTLQPTDREARLHLGLLHARTFNVRAACVELEEVLRASGVLSEDKVREARRKLVDMLIMSQRYADAKKHMEDLLKETPDDPELLELNGQILVGCGEFQKGCEQFERVIKVAPTQINTYVRLADVYRTHMDRKDDSEKVMHDMVYGKDKDGRQINEKSVSAHQKYAFYLREHEKMDEALIEANRVLELAPENSVGLWIAGCCYLAKGQYKPAEDYLSRGIKADKSDRAMYLVMADVKRRLGHPEEAIAIYKQGLSATVGTPGHADLLFELSNELVASGQFTEAAKFMQELRDFRLPPPLDRPYPPERVDFLEAYRKLMMGEWKAAKAILLDVLPSLHVPRDKKFAYFFLSQCYRQEVDTGRQIIALSEAVKIDPYFLSARQALADIYINQSNLALAKEQYLALMKAPRPSPDAPLSLARIWIMELLRKDKERRDWKPVDNLLERIEKQRSLDPNLAALKAEVLLAKGVPHDARRYLEECAGKFPSRVQIWLALINLAMYQAETETNPAEKENYWKQALDVINQARGHIGDQAILRTARGNLACRSKDPQRAEVLKRLGEDVAKLSDLEKRRLWGNLAALSIQINDFAMARSYFRLVAQSDPKNIVARYLLCDLALRVFEKGQTPDLQELDNLTAEIEKLGGRGPYWLYAKAIRTLVQSNKKDPQLLLEARGYLQDAMEARKDWSALAVLSAKICEWQDEPEQALDLYIHAIHDMGERDGEVLRSTVHLLLPHGRIQEAAQLIDYLEKQKSPLLSEMTEESEVVKAFVGDIGPAAKVIEQSVPPDSRKYQDFLRQGQLFGVLARRLKAEAVAAARDWEAAKADEKTTDSQKDEKKEKALQIQTKMIAMAQRAVNALMKARALDLQAHEVWIAIVQQLVDVGQPDKGVPYIDDAAKHLKGERAPITLAICWDLLKQTEKAQAKYEEAAKASPQNTHILRQVAAFYSKIGKFDRTESLLNRIIKLESPATLMDVCWARRGLALILKSRGDFEHFLKGLALIEENLHTKVASIEDKRAKVFFLLVDPRREKLGEAVQAMEDVVRGSDATPDDRLTLARLYLRRGQWADYCNEMHSVLGTQKGAAQPSILVFYVGSLLEKKEFEDADNWLKALEKIAPDLFETVQLRAEYEFLHRDYKAAAALVMDFALNPRPHVQPQDHGQQVFMAAQAMEKFGDRLQAEGKRVEASEFQEQAGRLFYSLRSRKVLETGEVLYAAYLARHERVGECLEILEQCWDKHAAEKLQVAAVAMIQSKTVDAAQFQRLDKIMTQAADKASRPVSLLLVLASLHARQGQYDKTIADYREIFAKEPRSYLVMNNLAVNLARANQNLDESLKLIDEALAICGPLPSVLDSRAVVHIARQEFDKAIEDATAAVKGEGTAQQFFHLAWAYSAAGKKAAAAAAFAEAIKKGLDPQKLDPREVPDYDRLKSEL